MPWTLTGQLVAPPSASAVRTDAAQNLSSAQQATARNNIGAADKATLGDTTTDYAAIFTASAT